MSDYKRLTKSGARVDIKTFKSSTIKGVEVYMFDPFSINTIISNLNRLAELEDKIEQGTLIELPCKVGDTVYWLFTTNIQQEIYECYVTEFIYNNKGLDICLSKKCLNGYAYFTLKDIGKTVFLTREEAEKKLKELQE